MTLLDWVPSITTAGLLAAALWLARNAIATRLAKSVEHEFNVKMESLRAELRTTEEKFKAEIRAKEAEMAALRSGVLNAMSNRQMALDKRRLEAVDQLWSAVVALGPAKAASNTMVYIKFEEAAKECERNPKAREVFAVFAKNIDLAKLDQSGASKARPFLSPMARAIFSAYHAIAMQAVAKLKVLESGLNAKGLFDKDAVAKLIKAALPHQAAYIDKYGDSAYHFLLDELEEKLLQELHAMVSGTESDKASVEHAAEIVRLSNSVLESSTKQ